MALSTLFRNFVDDPWEAACEFPAPRFVDQQPLGGVVPAAGPRVGYLYPGYAPFGPVVLPRWCHRTVQLPQQTGVAEVVNDHEEFRVNMDLRHFQPEEVFVKTQGVRVVVSASHRERPDQHGCIKRALTRHYVLPKGVDPVTVTSSLSVEGVLTIKAPKLLGEAPKERVIPIIPESGPEPEPLARS